MIARLAFAWKAVPALDPRPHLLPIRMPFHTLPRSQPLWQQSGMKHLMFPSKPNEIRGNGAHHIFRLSDIEGLMTRIFQVCSLFQLSPTCVDPSLLPFSDSSLPRMYVSLYFPSYYFQSPSFPSFFKMHTSKNSKCGRQHIPRVC